MRAPTEKPPPAIQARYWGVVVAWMLVISYLSTDAFSASNTHHYLDPVVRWLYPGISNPELRFAHTLIRKGAHFAEFFVLGALCFWAQRAGRAISWRGRWAFNAMALVVVYAGLDELHQAFTRSRTPAFSDTGVDILGGAASLIVLYARHRFASRSSLFTEGKG